MLFRAFRFFLLPLLVFLFSSYNAQIDSDHLLIIKEFRIIGNKTTQNNIITREIPFEIGDTLLTENLKEEMNKMKNNLFNTSLFNFITIEVVYFDELHISFYITVEERWYWWPIPVFEVQETNFNTWWADRDFKKVNYGLYLLKDNFRGRKESISFLLQGGYTEQFGIKYKIPYINKKKTKGVNMAFNYLRNRELSYSTTSNKRDYYRSDNEYAQRVVSSSIGYEFRPKLYVKHNLNLGYTNINVSDSILALNNDFLFSNQSKSQYFSLKYKFKWDKRNVKNYPTKGSYFDFKANKDGLGLTSKLNSLFLSSHLKMFWKLSNNLFFSSSIKAKYTVKEGAYNLLQGLGRKNDLVRGFDLYVIDGENYGLSKMQLRFSLLKDKTYNVNAISFEKFKKVPLDIYFGTYFDAGYVDSKNKIQTNFLANTTLYGGGFSLDFVSYYDLVLRVEYSINKLNEKGLFLHFIAPI